jgi:hypothetical protein
VSQREVAQHFVLGYFHQVPAGQDATPECSDPKRRSRLRKLRRALVLVLGIPKDAAATSCPPVHEGSGGATDFNHLLDACASFAREAGRANLVAGTNLARYEVYRCMLARGFRTEMQGVTMHKPNEGGYSRPGLFIIDDWR